MITHERLLREELLKTNHKEEDRHEKISPHVVRLNRRYLHCHFLNWRGGRHPRMFYRGSSPNISPGFPLKHMGMTDFGKLQMLRSKLRGIQPT